MNTMIPIYILRNSTYIILSDQVSMNFDTIDLIFVDMEHFQNSKKKIEERSYEEQKGLQSFCEISSYDKKGKLFFHPKSVPILYAIDGNHCVHQLRVVDENQCDTGDIVQQSSITKVKYCTSFCNDKSHQYKYLP